MNQQRIEKYTNELASQLQQYQKVAQEQDQLNGMAQMAASMNDRERGAKLTEMLMQNVPLIEGMSAAVQEKANRTTMEGSIELYTDLTIRLQRANQLYQNWRGALAGFELAAKLDKFASPEQRAESEATIAEAKEAFEAQLALADALIPNKATLLTVSPVGLL